MSRLSLGIARSFMGNCLIVTDNETNKKVEIMAAQLQAIAKTERTSGSLPHGGWDKDGDIITIYHDEKREIHEVSFTIDEIMEELN